jgi:hypothetical protein
MSNTKVQVTNTAVKEQRIKVSKAQQELLDKHPAYNLESITPSRYRTPHGKYGARINLITLVNEKKAKLTFVEEIG